MARVISNNLLGGWFKNNLCFEDVPIGISQEHLDSEFKIFKKEKKTTLISRSKTSPVLSGMF